MIRFQDAHRQQHYSVRLEWGPTGAAAIIRDCDVAVVVDVLSFTTSLTIAASRGATVFPFRWRDKRAARFAEERDAVLAVGRSEATAGQVSLSPQTIRDADSLQRLVLPSPNGSSISFQLANDVQEVVGVSLLNRRIVAEWLARRRAETPMLRVAIIAAGERWPDGTLRPAIEDLWGAGALVGALHTTGWKAIAPEAIGAAAAFAAVENDIAQALGDCASGRELIDMGYPDDVRAAGQLDESLVVPVLRNDAFHPLSIE